MIEAVFILFLALLGVKRLKYKQKCFIYTFLWSFLTKNAYRIQSRNKLCKKFLFDNKLKKKKLTNCFQTKPAVEITSRHKICKVFFIETRFDPIWKQKKKVMKNCLHYCRKLIFYNVYIKKKADRFCSSILF